MFAHKVAQRVIQRRFKCIEVPELRNSTPSTGPSTTGPSTGPSAGPSTGPSTGINIGSVASIVAIIGGVVGTVGMVGKGSLELTKLIRDEARETVKPIESKIDNVKKELRETVKPIELKIDNVKKELGDIKSELNQVSETLKTRKWF